MISARFAIVDDTIDPTDPRWRVYDRGNYGYLPGYWNNEEAARAAALAESCDDPAQMLTDDLMKALKSNGDERFEEMAEIAGRAGGLTPEQWPGLAIIFRAIAKEERDACARVSEEYGIARYHYEAEGKGGKQDAMTAAKAIATLIRGRGET